MTSEGLRLDAIAFKDDAQRGLKEKLEGLDETERIKRVREIAEAGSLGRWWRSAAAPAVSGAHTVRTGS